MTIIQVQRIGNSVQVIGQEPPPPKVLVQRNGPPGPKGDKGDPGSGGGGGSLTPVINTATTYNANANELVMMNQSGAGTVKLPLTPAVGTQVAVQRRSGNLTITAQGSDLINGQLAFGMSGLSFPFVTLEYVSAGVWALTQTSGPMPFGLSVGAQGGYQLASSPHNAPYDVQGGDKVTYVAPFNTTVTAASNGVDVSTFTGSGVLNVASAPALPFEYTGAPAFAGYLVVRTSAGYAVLSFTSSTTGQVGGVTLVTGSGTLSTGAGVFAAVAYGVAGLDLQSNIVTFIINTGSVPLPVVTASGGVLNGATNAIYWLAAGEAAYVHMQSAAGAGTVWMVSAKRAGRPSPGDRFVAAKWYPAVPQLGAATAPAQNTAHAVAFLVNDVAPFSGIGVNVTVAGGAGAVVDLGVYADNGRGYPGALVKDFGTAAATTTGAVTITSPLSLPPGLYWLVAVPQGSATTPTMATVSQVGAGSAQLIGSPSPGAAAPAGWTVAGVSGALPATFPAGAAPPNVVVLTQLQAGAY